MHPSFQILSQRFPSDGESVPVDELVLQQIMQDNCTRAGNEIVSAKRIKDIKARTMREAKKKETGNKCGKVEEPNLEKGT